MRAEQRIKITDYIEYFKSDVQDKSFDWAQDSFNKAKKALPNGHHPLSCQLAKISVRLLPRILQAGEHSLAKEILNHAVSATKDKKVRQKLQSQLETLSA